MKRYRDTKILKTPSGKRYYETTIFPTIEPSNDDIYIITSSADRLDKLAYDFYGQTSKWFIIAIANNIGLGTMLVEPGIQIRIPADTSGYDLLIEQLNS